MIPVATAKHRLPPASSCANASLEVFSASASPGTEVYTFGLQRLLLRPSSFLAMPLSEQLDPPCDDEPSGSDSDCMSAASDSDFIAPMKTPIVDTPAVSFTHASVAAAHCTSLFAF
ncbi:hypothetical protein NM688_g956 [Phlebia brevispora]|uniref:Uncharacterized protein n=1 Tax=Phlebia brevispora TaxID=194682 RepID=A0ACC1TCW4_9APHY|nr:hypothetical protein NM688_g956 [Phlebia brevispora]